MIASLILVSVVAATTPIAAQQAFDNIEMIESVGGKVKESGVRVEFGETTMRIASRSGGSVVKEWSYAEIRSAEYSYSKNPRWKTGLGLGAASVVVPLLLLVAIPVGFTKHRRHWVTIKTDSDYVVLKVGKGIRKIFMPAFETSSGVKIQALGENK